MTPTIPRGVEVLLKKAAVDAEFKAQLLAERAAAAQRLGLELTPGEVAMLAAMPAAQLDAVIQRTTVPARHRSVFLGHAAALMLAALGTGALAGCADGPTDGIRPDRPPARPEQPVPPGPTDGIRPDRPPARPDPEAQPATQPAAQPAPPPATPPPATQPETPATQAPNRPVTKGIRPDRPITLGIQPDRPRAAE